MLLRSRLALAGLLMVVLIAVLHSRGGDAQSPPNIIFILSDDQDLKTLAFMTKTRALLEAHGTRFENCFVTSSLCCPSRATILRGQYPHNTRIQGNYPPDGGFLKFRALGHEHSNVATWLDAGGYLTAHLGKFMNGYSPVQHGVPPGWDEWHRIGSGYRNYNYTFNENGAVIAYGDDPKDYLTDVLARKAARIIRRAADAGRSFFVHIAPFAPHAPAVPAPRHHRLFADAKFPRPPSFNEADVTDKPTYVRWRPRLDTRQIKNIEDLYPRRLASLQATDDMVETLVETLRATKQLKNTFIFYTSDNGYRTGEHRLRPGKGTAYEEDIHVPLIVRGPGVPAGNRLRAMVLNTDLAPTFAQIAGVESPGFVDGRSLLPLLGHRKVPWRQSFMIGRLELDARERTERSEPVRFKAIRTARWSYMQYAGDDGREL